MCCSAQAALAWGALKGGSKGEGAGKAMDGRTPLILRAGGYPGDSYRVNRDWNMQGNVGEDPEERKGSIAAQALSLAICVLILLGHTYASSAPYGRERLKWFRQDLLRAPHSWGGWSKESGKQLLNLGWTRGFVLPVPSPRSPISLRGQAHDNDHSSLCGWQRLSGRKFSFWSPCEWTEMLFSDCNSRIHSQEGDGASRNKINS